MDPLNPGSAAMSDDEFDAAIAEIDRALVERGATIMFWICPVDAHRRPYQGVQTVEWRGNVAHCTFPGCGRTSTDPRGDDDATQDRPAEGQAQA